jgi:hypothetical protein
MVSVLDVHGISEATASKLGHESIGFRHPPAAVEIWLP